MFRNTVLCLTLQILASITESQILQNRQPWNYANFEQVPRVELARQNPVVPQAPAILTPVRTDPLGICTTNENQPIIWDKLVTKPNTNPNNYENIIRKYDSMVNPPNVVNNYHVPQPEQVKRIDNNYNKNRHYGVSKYNNINRSKAEKSRRRKEHPVRNYNGKGKKNRKYRQSEEHNRKKKDNKPLGDYAFNDTVNNNASNVKEEFEGIDKNHLDYNNELKKEFTDTSTPTKNEIGRNKNTQDLNQNKKQLNQTSKEKYKKRNTDNHSTRNSKKAPAIEYQTQYFNHDEFNKYLQNLIAGNITSPYYFANDIYPYLFDSFYKTSHDSTKSKNKNPNKHKNAKKSNKSTMSQNKEEDCDTVIELSPNFHEATPVTITTGAGPKKDIYLNLKIKKKDLQPDSDNINSVMPENINEDHLQVISDKEFAKKPHTINLFNPFEDDVEYYPDFTLFNHAYLTSSEEEELNQIQKNRDYRQNDWDYYADRVKSYVEQSNKKSHINPHLGFRGDVNTNVETIYAPSRVVNYSQIDKETQNHTDEENFWFKEGDTTVVLSRSMNIDK
ncbi:GATA zinc finger domain-containing protein 14-like [Aricia agestis]|uniref:GATA zinc finger domain-containing protein 14-like n=1 Tax=Aricia agestis TaxID=91739 RepID=UPI001C20B132|nr:GATA zinc finger domain-containing protein 14-like [Aricia agestis]